MLLCRELIESLAAELARFPDCDTEAVGRLIEQTMLELDGVAQACDELLLEPALVDGREQLVESVEAFHGVLVALRDCLGEPRREVLTRVVARAGQAHGRLLATRQLLGEGADLLALSEALDARLKERLAQV